MNLIIGNGLIGRHLYYLLREDAELLTRKEIDLSQDSWEIPKCKTAYICAGATSTKECEEHPEETRLVNVINTVKLAQRLLPAKVIWISSERVFDGSIPYRKVTDFPCPTTEYGRQKAEAERLLLDLGVSVVRFSKVLGWDVPLFEGWIDNLKQDLPIEPIENVSMSPISVYFAASVLRNAPNGLSQISADTNINYAHIASFIASLMNKNSTLVRPVHIKIPHPYTTLESNIPIDIPSAWTTIERWCQNRLVTGT